MTRLQELAALTQYQSVQSTRFKDKLLASIPGPSASAKGKEVSLVFENDIVQVLSESPKENGIEKECLSHGRPKL